MATQQTPANSYADYNEIDAGWKNKDMDTKARNLCAKSKCTQCACADCTCVNCSCPPKQTQTPAKRLLTESQSNVDYTEIDAGWLDDEMDTKARNQCAKRKDRTDLGCHDCVCPSKPSAPTVNSECQSCST
jgi:hypothetical protein